MNFDGIDNQSSGENEVTVSFIRNLIFSRHHVERKKSELPRNTYHRDKGTYKADHVLRHHQTHANAEAFPGWFPECFAEEARLLVMELLRLYAG